MRTLFLVLFLFTLSSSRRLYRRSEDVDPLLKELFSETKEPPAKDRRDGQKSGDSEPGSDDDTEQMSQAVNKTSSLDSQEKQDDDSDEVPKDSDGPSNESANHASTSPKDDKPSDKSPDSQAKDDGMEESEDSKDDDSNIMKSDSDSSGDSELFSSEAGESVKKDKSTSVSSDEKSPKLSGKESAVTSPELAKVNDKSAKPGDKTPDVTATKDQSDHTSDVASASVHPQTPDVTAEKGQSDHTSDVASASVHPQTPDVTAEKDQSDHASDVASASVHPQSTDVTAEKSQSDHAPDVASASVHPQSTDVTAEKDQSDHASDVASASVHPQSTDVTAEKDQSDHAPDVASASVHPQSTDVTAEKDQSDHASDVASASVHPQTSDVTAAKDQSDHSSDSASVNPPVAASVQAEKQQPTVSGNHGAEINSDTSQSMNPNTMENTKSNIPETPTSSDVLPNVVRQSSNNANLRSNIPQVPAAAVPRQDWPAVNQFHAVPETNEKGSFMKKDAIPVAPSQPGASSYPLQLNKHSPGAELMKRFFIAKKEAKKRKEEEAKQKSLIGDGKYTVNSNNGFYNYAAVPKVPAPSVNALTENGKEGICVDKFDSCPEFAKNHYCTDYKTLMKVQCRKSCKFCDSDDDDDDDDDDEDVGKSVKQDDDKKEKETKTKDDDDDDDDSDAKTEDKNEQKQTKKKKKIEKDSDDDDDDDDDDDAKLKSSESDEKHSDGSGDSEVVSDSGSGPGADEKFEDLEPSDKGSGSGEDLPPTAEEFEDEDEKEKDSGSGSGGDDNDDDDNEGDDLAKDLAEQELFSQNTKKDSIPSPTEHAASAPYPKIDLKDIARYVSLYRNVAKKLFGEALDSAKKEFVVQQSKRSDIPIPIKEKLDNEVTDSSSSLEGFYSSQNSKKRDDIPMKPNNAQYTPTDETWANRAYQEAESYLRNKIPAFKNYAPPAMFNYPFYINDPNKTVEETNEGTSYKKSEIPENPEEKYNKTLQDILKRDHINKPSSDPYQYLRDMIPGSSMKPIASKNGITYVPDSFSRPIQLRTKSQWQELLAKKKSGIPRVPQSVQGIARSGVARPKTSVPQIPTRAEALAAQVTQYTSAGSPVEVANDVQDGNIAPQSSNSYLSQPGVARAEVPQPQMQQVSPAQSSNFLQSNEAVDQVPNAASSFSEVQPNNKVTKTSISNLPPLLHGSSENAKGFHLPPLNHGGLPPLHHTSNNPSNFLTSESTKSASKGASYTAQYHSQPSSNQVKAQNALMDKQSDKPLLKEKVFPVQEMQIGIPNAYSSPHKQSQPLHQVPLKSQSAEQTPKIRQFPDPNNPYPEPLPPEGSSTQYAPPPNQAPPPSAQVPGGMTQHLLPANPNPAYVPEENYVVPVLKKNLIRPKPDMECGSGFKGASGDFGNFCYKIMYKHQTWQSARDSCKSLNADLFSVKNAYEQRFIDGLATSPLWIGYQDKASDGTWSWSDSSTTVYTNWDSSSQKDGNQQTDCVILDSDEGKWRDVPCSDKNKFICKKNGDCDVHDGWKMLTLSSLKGCYKPYDKAQTWDDASQTCNKDGGNLASILSDDEQIMISQVYSNNNLWIGYSDRENEGDWTWTDKTTSSYTNWDEASPNNGGVSCALVSSPSGSWRDESCKKKHDYICKKYPKGFDDDTIVDDAISPPVAALLQNQTEDTLLEDLYPSAGSAPAVPVYFWPLLKTTNGRTRGTEHAEAHGKVRQVQGGIELNGVDAWLDGGDFHGKCFSDPDLCIKGLSVAMQVNFDSRSRSYHNKHVVLDTSGGKRGVSVYMKNNSLYYRVSTGTKSWELTSDLMTNEWQDVVMTWKKEDGLTLYVNGAFKDNIKEGRVIFPVKDEQTHLLVGKNKDDVFTKMYISSISVYPRVLTTENIPFVFTYDDTVLPSYRWLLSKLTLSLNKRGIIPTTKSVKVKGSVRPVDGGLFVSGDEDSFIDAGDFSNECLSHPGKCQTGFSYSCKLKFNKNVRSYTERRFILDSGAGHDESRGISAYIINNNLYFDVAMSTAEDTLRWTVRAPLYTIRWQRVALSWSLAKGLTLYMDGNFRGSTKLPKSVPIVTSKSNSHLIIGKKNKGPHAGSAEFSISSLAVYDRYLSDSDMGGLFGDKSLPYPGLIREIWRDIPGSKISDLRSSAYYPNDPSDIQIIENFDSPFDLDKNYGTKVKGYFIPPESGSYTFYLAGSRSAELWLSGDEYETGLKRIISFMNGSAHNQWDRWPSQNSKPVNLEAGRYYFVVTVQKGTTSSDSLSAGVKLPSGRFIRPLSKETLQWRLKGNHHSGLIREVWQDMGGFQVADLTSNTNFPNNPSSVEVIDNFDAPFNVEDNYGARVRGFFNAPETGYYRFYLAADSTGELWISSDKSEANLRKMVSITGWTDHNEWLKYAEQKSEKVYMNEGKSYYITVYQKAEKLGDCASVAMEMPSGHFEGPIKQKHLSWKLPDGQTGPGPSSESSALPKPVALFPLDNTFGAKDVINQEQVLVKHVHLTKGPDGRKTAYEFSGDENSYIEIPKTNKLDTHYSMTLLASVYPTGKDGPIMHYTSDKWGVHLWQFNDNQLFVRFVRRDGEFTEPLAARVLQKNKWNEVGASYDNTTGVVQLWHDGKMVKSRNIGQIELRTQFPIRLGAESGDKRHFRGKISCIQVYDRPLTAEQVGTLRRCPVKGFNDGEHALGSGEEDSEELTAPVALSVNQLQEEDTEEEIQGSEVTSVNKCRPNPCQNDGRCVVDLRRMDGYHCRCTSDFAGRHCQVSKPNANSPMVKKTTIAKPSPDAVPKEGVENYQKVDTTKKFQGKVSKNKKEDVYLLYQKVGCYQDNVIQRDLPARPSVKSVTQEVCVRECAIRDEGFSYFGLQNGTKCYCGKDYGKYGKTEDEKCNMRCKGNEDENCGGNKYNMVYFYGIGTNYTMRTFTGNTEGAGTKANIYVTLFGDKGDSGFRLLTPGEYKKGSVETQVMVLPDLGNIRKLKVLHDNSGDSPSWFLDKIIVDDERGKSYEFICSQWLSETQGGGRTERLLTLRKRKRSQH